MTKHDEILQAAESVWDGEGFGHPGIDRIIAAAHTTPRTLYRHFRSKEALVEAVLAKRQARYRRLLQEVRQRFDDSYAVLGVFDALEEWLTTMTKPRGCLFLRALSEYGLNDSGIAQVVKRYKGEVLTDIRALVAQAGRDPHGALPDHLVLLIEGATALAPVIGAGPACRQAQAAAKVLLDELPGNRNPSS